MGVDDDDDGVMGSSAVRRQVVGISSMHFTCDTFSHMYANDGDYELSSFVMLRRAKSDSGCCWSGMLPTFLVAL